MSSGDDELGRFVGEALTRGVSRASISQALAQAGWTAEQGRAALAAWADVEFPVPVPRPRPQLPPSRARRDAPTAGWAHPAGRHCYEFAAARGNRVAND